MKKILTILIVSAMLLTMFSSCSKKSEESGSDSKENNAADITEKSDDKAEEGTVRFKSSEEITEAFMNACKDGDTETMYSLYYNNMLDATYERIKDNISKEDFDERLKTEMTSFTTHEVYNYGDEDLPSTVSPLYYVDYTNYGMTGADTGLTEEQVTDCAVLRVYNETGAYSDHMFAKIDGDWYVTM